MTHFQGECLLNKGKKGIFLLGEREREQQFTPKEKRNQSRRKSYSKKWGGNRRISINKLKIEGIDILRKIE